MRLKYLPFIAVLSFAGCGGGGDGGSKPDTEPPQVAFSVNKEQHRLFEDVFFSGSATDNVGVASSGIDTDHRKDSDLDGNPINDSDLPYLNATLSGGYKVPGKYIANGWARDSYNTSYMKARIMIKPHEEFDEVQESPLDMVFKGLTIPFKADDWNQFYLGFSENTRKELDALQGRLSQDERIIYAQVVLKDNRPHILYAIECPNAGFNFDGTEYYGTLPITQDASTDIIERIKSIPGPPIVYWGSINGGSFPDGRGVIAWIDVNGNGKYDPSGAFTPSGSEDFNSLKHPTQGGYYGVQVVPDDPRTMLIEGYNPQEPMLDKATVMIDGNVCDPVNLPLNSPGSYMRNVTRR